MRSGPNTSGWWNFTVQCLGDLIPFNCFAIWRRAPYRVTPYTVVITVCLITFRLMKPSSFIAISTPASASFCLSPSTWWDKNTFTYRRRLDIVTSFETWHLGDQGTWSQVFFATQHWHSAITHHWPTSLPTSNVGRFILSWSKCG